MHILVVDDDQAVRDSLARSLQYSGYEVTTANDGVDALARLSSLRPDAVIMDVKIPKLVIPVKPGRNLAIIIEIAARNLSLKRMGYSAAQELDKRLNSMMEHREEDEA